MQNLTRWVWRLAAALGVLLAAVLVLSPAQDARADLGDATSVFRGGLVSATTTVQSVTISDMAPAAFYFKNRDGADTVVVKFGGATAAYAGTSADYTNQLHLDPGESARLDLFNVRTFSVDASGNADLEWRAAGFER